MYRLRDSCCVHWTSVLFLETKVSNPQSPKLRDGEQRLPKRGGVTGDDGEKATLASTHASSPLGTQGSTRRLI